SGGDVMPDEARPVEQALDSVVAFASDAANQEMATFETETPAGVGPRRVGNPGSARGTGNKPVLGSGTGLGGFPREQRWFIRFADQEESVDEYAKQLDFFGIEFGAIIGGKLVYISNFTAPRPAQRTESSGAGEKRLYMTWQGGGRKQADLQLFRKAGIDVGNGVIFHFYPKETEDRLAQLERAYRNRVANDIRRTYFSVERTQRGYQFTVSHQNYLK